MQKIGKFFQVAALVILPVAMLLEIGGLLGRTSGLAEMLKLLLVGICLFGIGRVVEGYALSQST